MLNNFYKYVIDNLRKSSDTKFDDTLETLLQNQNKDVFDLSYYLSQADLGVLYALATDLLAVSTQLHTDLHKGTLWSICHSPVKPLICLD